MSDLCDVCKSRGRLGAGAHVMVEFGETIRKCDSCRASRLHVLGKKEPEACVGATQRASLLPDGCPALRAADIKFHGLPPAPARRGIPAEEEKLPRKIEMDWNAVQKIRDTGATLSDLAKRFGLSQQTIANHTVRAAGLSEKPPRQDPPASSNGHRPTGEKRPGKFASEAGSLIERLQDEIAKTKNRVQVLEAALTLLEEA